MAKEFENKIELVFSDEVRKYMKEYFKTSKNEDHFKPKPMSQIARVSLHKAISILALQAEIGNMELIDAILLSFFEKEFGMIMPDKEGLE